MLHTDCYELLRLPTKEEKSFINLCGSILQLRCHEAILFAVFSLLIGIALFAYCLHSAYSLVLWILPILSSYVFIVSIFRAFQKAKMLRAIAEGSYRVAQGVCRKIIRDSRYSWEVYGSIGAGGHINIGFSVNEEFIKKMPGDEWDFLLIVSGKHTEVLLPSPNNKPLVADRVLNWSGYPYAIED